MALDRTFIKKFIVFLLAIVCVLLAYATILITVSPASVTLHSGDAQQFNAAASGLGQNVKLAVVWSATAGIIDQSGLFTAPTVASSKTVTVKAARIGYQQKQYGTATVTVLSGTQAHSVDLTWDVDPEAVSYSIYRGTSPDGSFALLASAITGTAYSDAGVIAGQTYYYAATATNSSGQESGYSNVTQAVIPNP